MMRSGVLGGVRPGLAACLRNALFSILVPLAVLAWAKPSIFWTSDPVGPDQTLLLTGGVFGNQPRIEMAHLPDGAAGLPPAAAPAVPVWAGLDALQPNDGSVKARIPKAWPRGVYAVRITSGGSAGDIHLVNAPDPWWMQGDQGSAASPGGWLRIFGRNMDLNADGPAAPGVQAALLADGRVAQVLKAAQGDSFSLRFDIPAAVAPGAYSIHVHNGHGGPAAWRACPANTVDFSETGTFPIRPKAAWPDRVYDVSTFAGADAQARARAALAEARRNGGGTVYFPAGTWELTDSLRIPDRVLLKGKSREEVRLVWTPGAHIKESDALLVGETFAAEELTLAERPSARSRGHVILAGHRSDGFRVHRVRLDLAQKDSLDIHKRAVILCRGRNFSITDNVIDGAVGGFASEIREGAGPTMGRVSGNRFRVYRLGVAIIAQRGGSDGTVVEDNSLITLGSDFNEGPYSHLATYGGAYAQNHYFARNRTSSVIESTRNAWTFDGSDGTYFGKPVSVSGTRLRLRHPLRHELGGKEPPPEYVGASVHILDGTGAGQYRRLAAFSGPDIDVDRPWDIPPDTGSVISVVTFMGRALVVDNAFEDRAEYISAYYSAADVVFSGNRVAYPDGSVGGTFSASGGHVHAGVLPNWHFQCLNNVIFSGKVSMDSKGTAFNPKADYSVRLGLDYSWYKGPNARASIFRGNVNSAASGGHIGVGGSGGFQDGIIEGNFLNAGSRILVESTARHVYQGDNITGHPPIALGPPGPPPGPPGPRRIGDRLILPEAGVPVTFRRIDGRRAGSQRVPGNRTLDLAAIPHGSYLVENGSRRFRLVP